MNMQRRNFKFKHLLSLPVNCLKGLRKIVSQYFVYGGGIDLLLLEKNRMLKFRLR